MTETRANATRTQALVDLCVLGVAFWGVMSLRWVGVEKIGLWSVLAGVAAGAVLLALRRGSRADIGLVARGDAPFVLRRAGEFVLLALATGWVVIAVATAIGYPPTESAVLTHQPVAPLAFVLDIVVGVWLGAAVGEEVFFRGFLLAHFTTLFGGGRRALTGAVVAQAIWFGSGHISQGVSGMIMAGAIGAVVGAFFLTRARRSLLPLIIGHGVVDTVSQSIHYFGRP